MKPINDEYEESLNYQFSGFFDATGEALYGPTTYIKQGVRIHKPPMEGFWNNGTSHIKTAEFRNMDGKVTDAFYGNCNDFTEWFNAKASKGEKFSVYVKSGGIKSEEGLIRVGRIETWIGSVYTHEEWQTPIIQQKITGEWEKVE